MGTISIRTEPINCCCRDVRCADDIEPRDLGHPQVNTSKLSEGLHEPGGLFLSEYKICHPQCPELPNTPLVICLHHICTKHHASN